jgi:ribosome biogenesis GTPase / thiamine phosphate phosphatase
MDLVTYGWDGFYQRNYDAFRAVSGEPSRYFPGRVTAVFGSSWQVMTGDGEICAGLAGRIRHDRYRETDADGTIAGLVPGQPAVGDWVAVDRAEAAGTAMIAGVLPRKGAITRTTAGATSDAQVLAANVDIVFLVMALGADCNPARMERYLVMVRESGAAPVILLNKADQCADPDGIAAAILTRSAGAPVHVMSAIDGRGIAEINGYLSGNRTGVFLGSSGAGKSTIINRLLGRELITVAEVSEYKGKGRHTTTARQLYVLDQGGVVIDTPGMRELQLRADAAGMTEVFGDIEALARTCRFPDCCHGNEPDCAITAALSDGRLEDGRYRSYLKLRREVQSQEARQRMRAKIDEHRKIKRRHLRDRESD